MTQELSKLAQASLAIYTRETSAGYQRLSELLNSGLGRKAIDSYRQESLQAEANVQLAKNFVRLLPLAKIDNTYPNSPRHHFVASHQDEAKYLQTSIIWDRTSRWTDGAPKGVPYYILGVENDKKYTHLLLVGALQKSHEVIADDPQLICTIKIKTKEFEKLQKRHQHILGHPYSAAELATGMYNHHINQFNLTETTPGMSFFVGGHRDYVSTEQEYGGGASVISRAYERLTSQLAATTFEKMDVFGKMCNLAVQFGQVEAADALFAVAPAFLSRQIN